MHDMLIALVMGMVEGLTEFIPVSSTGHLIFTGHILGFTGQKASAFEIIIQLGAILAVVLLYWEKFVYFLKPKPLIAKIENLFMGTKNKVKGLTLLEIVAGMIPAVVLGFLLKGIIKSVGFNSTVSVALAMIVGAILLIVVEKVHGKTTVADVDNITVKQAFLIGVMQCLSLWPGFSRSGATISGGVLFGLDRKAAAEFSFILAVPMMLAATVLELKDVLTTFTAGDILQLAVGFAVSFVVAYFSIVYFMRLLSKVSFIPFAVYRLILGVIVLLVLI